MIKFGTDGWRSLMDGSFNVENVKKVAQAIAEYLKRREVRCPAKDGTSERQGKVAKIFIGYDTRNNSDVFAKACADVMLDNNIEVFLPERAMPTPITAFTIKANGLDGAIMITASHNPSQYNGIKFIPYYAGPATEDITTAIENNLQRTEDPSAAPQDDKKRTGVNPIPTSNSEIDVGAGFTPAREIDPIPQYRSHLKSLIDTDLLSKANLNVLVDPMYGAAYGLFAQILEEFGCDVKEVNAEPDPNFGGLTPEPIPQNLGGALQELKKGTYDLVLALDGDADRFGAFDGQANFIPANHVLALIADYLITVRKVRGSLVRSVATTHFLDFIADKNDLELIETPVGFKHIGQVMREKPVVLGGEESAGLSILGHIPEKDGLLANLLLAEITAYYKKPLSQALEDLFTKYNRHFLTKRLDLELEAEQKERLINNLQTNPPTEIDGLKVTQTVDIDGVKFILEDESWLLARPSGTEPIIRIYLEANQERTLKKLEAYAKELTLPI